MTQEPATQESAEPKPRVLISTYDRTDGDRLERQKTIVWNNADKMWLEGHLKWALHNDRRVTIERIG